MRGRHGNRNRSLMTACTLWVRSSECIEESLPKFAYRTCTWRSRALAPFACGGVSLLVLVCVRTQCVPSVLCGHACGGPDTDTFFYRKKSTNTRTARPETLKGGYARAPTRQPLRTRTALITSHEKRPAVARATSNDGQKKHPGVLAAKPKVRNFGPNLLKCYSSRDGHQTC